MSNKDVQERVIVKAYQLGCGQGLLIGAFIVVVVLLLLGLGQ